MNEQRTALVTGAARGIGLATARQLLQCGQRVALLDRALSAEVKELNAAHPNDTLLIEADISDRAALATHVKHIERTLGTISTLVNNAGVSPKINGRSAGIMEITDAEFDLVMNVNLRAVIYLCQLCIPGMKAQAYGRIVNVASLAGRTKSVVSGATYMASKAGVIGISRSIAAEMAPFGITTNCVAPGRILTEMAMQAPPEVNENYAKAIPVRRLGTPDEVAHAIAFLCEPSSGFINGAVIDINGGFYMP